MSSFTVTFSGNSSVLRADFNPEITLDPNSNYYCALLDFTAYNSIPNIIKGDVNQLRIKYKTVKIDGRKKTIYSEPMERSITLPTGSYEVENILEQLKIEFNEIGIKFAYEINVITLKVRIAFDVRVDWIGGPILKMLGFTQTNFQENVSYESESIIRITEIDIIRIECDIASSSYINGRQCHTIHQFSHCKVKPGYKFIEVPQHLIYLPIRERHQLRTIEIRIVDQKGDLINFQNEQISCRIHIKKVLDSERV